MSGEFFLKFIKFCAVGGSGVFVDFGITYFCKEILKINKYLSNSTGFICAATSNYILNRIWTFSSDNPHIAEQYLRFVAISLAGLALNNIVIWLLNDKLHVDFSRIVKRPFSARITERINFYCSKLLAIAVVTVWNFFMNYYFTF